MGCKLVPDADELYCLSCPMESGSYVTATLSELSKCNISDGYGIFNHNGKLVCEDDLPPNPDGLPEGPYMFDCHGCFVKDNNLTCTACMGKKFKRVQSTIQMAGCCMFKKSKKGKLKCETHGDCYFDGHPDTEPATRRTIDWAQDTSEGIPEGSTADSGGGGSCGSSNDADPHSSARDTAEL